MSLMNTRLTTSILAILYLGALMSFASPIPQAWQPGDIAKARPRHFQHPLPNTQAVGKHPVVVLTHPDEHGFVKVATVSHVHPFNPPTKPASTYGVPIDPHKGDSKINVSGPETIHVSKLSQLVVPERLHDHHVHALKSEIRKNCPGVLRKRTDPHGRPDPCDRSSIQAAAIRAHEMHTQAQHRGGKKSPGGHKGHPHGHTSSHPSGSGRK